MTAKSVLMLQFQFIYLFSKHAHIHTHSSDFIINYTMTTIGDILYYSELF